MHFLVHHQMLQESKTIISHRLAHNPDAGIQGLVFRVVRPGASLTEKDLQPETSRVICTLFPVVIEPVWHSLLHSMSLIVGRTVRSWCGDGAEVSGFFRSGLGPNPMTKPSSQLFDTRRDGAKHDFQTMTPNFPVR